VPIRKTLKKQNKNKKKQVFFCFLMFFQLAALRQKVFLIQVSQVQLTLYLQGVKK
jgi:hypothetical protein